MKIHLQLSPDGQAMLGTDDAGNELRLSLPETAGGNATGFGPMKLMIMSLGGCAAVDVLSILKKQRQPITGLRIDIEAERFQQPLPAPWATAHLVFTVFGAVNLEKAEKAATMSLEKYCSASETLRLAGATISWSVLVQP
ncbi:MAG: OsmC family protein [Saprospiraceae bacterium]|nr:OsmC family protein [Saprospiraceae bacterium]